MARRIVLIVVPVLFSALIFVFVFALVLVFGLVLVFALVLGLVLSRVDLCVFSYL